MAGQGAGMQARIHQLLQGREALRVLDAGCGGRIPVVLPPQAELVGIDLSGPSAARNKKIGKIIIGDVQYHRFAPESFDAIICWDVLEHLPRPDLALLSFFDATKDDGIVILGLPNVWSLKGLVTKFTPFRFHVWFTRTIMKNKNAGKMGFGPFPTYLSDLLAPNALLRFCAAHDMMPDYVELYEGAAPLKLRRRSPHVFACYRSLIRLLNTMALGRHDFGLTDIRIILRRQRRRAAVSRTAAEALEPRDFDGEAVVPTWSTSTKTW